MKALLVVVDMQEDFIRGPLGTAEARAAVPKAAERIRAWEGEILYTLDTHREDYLDTQEGERLPAPHCIRGSRGWQLDGEVYRALAERGAADASHAVEKDTFGAKALPARAEALLGGKPQRIVLIGLCTDICVISNAILLKAFFPEARIAVDASCCAGVTPQSHQRALEALAPCQVDVIG